METPIMLAGEEVPQQGMLHEAAAIRCRKGDQQIARTIIRLIGEHQHVIPGTITIQVSGGLLQYAPVSRQDLA
ncbi:MAG: hypothetical protein R2815_06085 [Flavobacteriales bacterium]